MKISSESSGQSDEGNLRLHFFQPKTFLLSYRYPAGLFDSGSVLLNQNVNGCVHTYVNHSRMVAER